ncbi:hypothetical protein D9619_004032 [Psilocybe cf. subviscida]|uniref:Uncharacterized protein n=1 Tax=Psilocybe cf. subviscida TaxID=2480587 RepID=A0A8H5F8N5_9AGAR|nr:hypothetical protein D9619_004032 [Psilocybe cf. subviscida]
MEGQMHTPVDLLILGAGWTSTFLITLCADRGVTYAGTSRAGREGTIKFAFDPDSDDPTPYTVLPDARTVLITFPIDKPGASQRLVQLYSQTRLTQESEPRFIQLGTTSIWDGGRGATRTSSPESKWYDRHSTFTPTPRANAETELLQLAPQFLTSVINLAGLWGGTRSPRNWVARIASAKDVLKEKGSLHLIHGSDIAHIVLAMHAHKDFSPFLGQRWILTDGRVYDWWDLASAWGTPSSAPSSSNLNAPTDEVSSTAESDRGPQPGWVRELMAEAGVRALPRNVELLGRALDSRELWDTVGLSPLYARVEDK